MRTILFFIFTNLAFLCSAQNNFSKEFSLISDNDLYTSIIRDGYYTNGLFLNYKVLKKEISEDSPKKIFNFQVGHMMFTASKSTLQFTFSQDRPFAGYLFAGFGINRFYKSNAMFTTSFELGVIGPNAKGHELQNFMHGFFDFPDPSGWKHQINNAFALNLNASYLHYFKNINSATFDVSSYNLLKTGTVFTSISTGIYSRIGIKNLQPFSNSVAFNSNLNKNAASNKESFIFIKPMINYTLYDATIEGSFLNKTSPVTFDVMPFHFSIELGYRYYRKRFLYGYTYTYHTQKLKSLRAAKTNSFGSIYIGYYFN